MLLEQHGSIVGSHPRAPLNVPGTCVCARDLGWLSLGVDLRMMPLALSASLLSASLMEKALKIS